MVEEYIGDVVEGRIGGIGGVIKGRIDGIDDVIDSIAGVGTEVHWASFRIGGDGDHFTKGCVADGLCDGGGYA